LVTFGEAVGEGTTAPVTPEPDDPPPMDIAWAIEPATRMQLAYSWPDTSTFLPTSEAVDPGEPVAV